MYQSKIFANSSTTLPKPVRDALGVKAGDRVRYVISEDRVQVLKMPSGKLTRMIPLCSRLWTQPKMSWMKTEPSCGSLNKYWSPKYDETKIKEGQRVTRPDVGVLWVDLLDGSIL